MNPPWCHYCGLRRADTKDHIVPRAKGGSNRRINLTWACRRCNAAKADSWPTCGCSHCLDAIVSFMAQPGQVAGRAKAAAAARKSADR